MSVSVLSRKSASGPASAAKAASAIHSNRLRIGEPNDSAEQEADRVAATIMADGALAKPGWSLSKVGIGAPLQCKRAPAASSEEECNKQQARLQRRPAGLGTPNSVPPIVHEVLHSPGQPLDRETRAFLEPRYGHDFSQVRVHTDSLAAESAYAVDALAYTVGRDIVFATNQYASGGMAPQPLLAHELAHVVQQGAAPPLAGTSPRLISPTASAPGVLQRQVGHFAGGRPRVANMKALVEQKDKTANKEISGLLRQNRIDGKPVRVTSATIDSQRHEWRLSIQLDDSLVNKRGETANTVISQDHGIVVHTIPIKISTTLPSEAEEQELFPVGKKDRERVDFMAAEALYHELVHARDQMEHELPAGSSHSETFRAFTSVYDAIAASPWLQAEKRNLEAFLLQLARYAGGKFNAPNFVEPRFATEMVDMFIKEKHAGQTAARAFGLKKSWDNKDVAERYTPKVEQVLISLGQVRAKNFAANPLARDKIWNQKLQELEAAVTRFLDHIDNPAAARPSNVWERANLGGGPAHENVWERARSGAQ